MLSQITALRDPVAAGILLGDFHIPGVWQGPEPAALYPTGHCYRPIVFYAQVTCALVLEGHTYAPTKPMAVRSSWALPQPLRTVVPGPFSIKQKLPLALLITEKGQR